jgi:hypothetical protein
MNIPKVRSLKITGLEEGFISSVESLGSTTKQLIVLITSIWLLIMFLRPFLRCLVIF